MKQLLAIAMACALTACAQPVPYEGVTRTSYGPLSTQGLQFCHNGVLRPDLALAEGMESLSALNIATDLTALIATPFRSAMTIDETLKRSELHPHFKIPGDIGHANVAILERNENEIVFWYDMNLVKPQEVEAAAKDWCDRQNKKNSSYIGSAQRCSPPRPQPVYDKKTGKQIVVYLTQTISVFKCTGGEPASGSAGVKLPNSPTSFDRRLVRAVQVELARRGHLRGAVDGRYGPQTAAAIQEFQQKRGLSVDGTPSEALLEMLKAK